MNAPATPFVTYGCPLQFGTQLEYVKWAFANYMRIPDPKPAREELFRYVADQLMPGYFEWHDWTNRIVKSLCNHKWTGLCGCSNSAKTWNVSGFAALWWAMAPEQSSVILTSTTMKSLRKRAWSNFMHVHDTWGGQVGHMINSQTLWQAAPGEDKHAIFGMAVQEGNVDKTAANIQGIHTPRQMVIIDEAEATPTAIWKACANLYRYPSDVWEFILIAIGNPRSRLSQFGRFCEPASGWNSVSMECEEWDGRPQMDGIPSFVCRFDFLKSPNLASAKPVSIHLPTKASVSARLRALKARGAENDPDHWCYDRGFPPPEGLDITVMTVTMIEKHDGYGRHEFSGENFTIIGVFDPARVDGDRPAVRFGAYGEIGGGKMGIEWMPADVLYPDATGKEPIDYQLIAMIKAKAENVQYRGRQYQCKPENFGFDVTGAGSGMGDIAQREWSANIIRIEFGSAASDEPASLEDMRPGREVYYNKRAEMYMRTRNGLFSGQIKGIDRDTADELCALRLESRSGRQLIEKKIDYKKRMTVSPDLADTGVMLTEVARIKGFAITAMGQTAAAGGGIDELLKLAREGMHEPTYSADNDDYDYDA